MLTNYCIHVSNELSLQYINNLKKYKMKATERILKINTNGELVEYNARLRRFELTSRAWDWNDIHPDYLEESKENWEAYQEELDQN